MIFSRYKILLKTIPLQPARATSLNYLISYFTRVDVKILVSKKFQNILKSA
jgi:hypothetical protein